MRHMPYIAREPYWPKSDAKKVNGNQHCELAAVLHNSQLKMLSTAELVVAKTNWSTEEIWLNPEASGKKQPYFGLRLPRLELWPDCIAADLPKRDGSQ